jgi:hypothetical protein
LLCIFSVTKYHLRFNEQRKFNELEHIDISKAVDAKVLSQSLKGLKWITSQNPDRPKQELENLKEVVQFLRTDTTKKVLITDYQVLAPISGIYDFSPNQWHHPTVSFPIQGQKYFETYKQFFIENLKKNEIQFILETSTNGQTITELILDKSCINKKRLNEMLIKISLFNNCEDLK